MNADSTSFLEKWKSKLESSKMDQEIISVKLKNAVISSNVRLILKLDIDRMEMYKNIGEYMVLISRRNYHMVLAEKKESLLKVFWNHHETLRWHRMAYDESQKLQKLEGGSGSTGPGSGSGSESEQMISEYDGAEADEALANTLANAQGLASLKAKILEYNEKSLSHKKRATWWMSQMMIEESWVDSLKKEVKNASSGRDNLYVLIGLRTEFQKAMLEEKGLYLKLNKADSVWLRSTMAARVKKRIIYWDKMIHDYHPTDDGESDDIKQ